MSCLISRSHFEKVDGFVQRAIAAGARPILGGGPNTELGHLYYRPTILVDAEPGSEILTEEVFGPVLTVQTFPGEEQAVELANNTRFGLAATLVTGDPERAERVSARLSAGTVWVNCFFVRDLGAPFGGNGQLRHRSRGRPLLVRLLHRRQEHGLRPATAGPHDRLRGPRRAVSAHRCRNGPESGQSGPFTRTGAQTARQRLRGTDQWAGW